MHDLITKLLQSLGEDPTRDGLKKTPERWEKAMQFLTSGYNQSLEETVNGALFPAPREAQSDTNNMVLIKNIDFSSLCEHHILPFVGKVHVAYFPKKHVIGLSKIPRIIELFSRRLQTQERLGQQICDALDQTLKPKGVRVVIEAKHFCMQMRGVEKTESKVVTHHFSGEFLERGVQ